MNLTSNRSTCWLCRNIATRAALFLTLTTLSTTPITAQRVVDLTLERAVEMAMDDSYQVRRVRLEVERTEKLLQAELAGLKSQVYMNFALPEFEQISQEYYNFDTGRNEIVDENSRRWQMEFSIEQPVILFGYPTNGYLSLNNRVYRYRQFQEEDSELNYYNRYFVAYQQSLFQPNELKNDLEEAELDLMKAELDFQDDAIEIIYNTARNYNELFELSREAVILQRFVDNLEDALAAANMRAAADSSSAIEVSQAQVALSNARSTLQQARSDFRLEAARLKPDLGLSVADSIVIDPTIALNPIEIDSVRAIELGMTLRPQLRQLEIRRRENEIDLENVRGRNSFRMDLEITYGREMEDPQFSQLMDDPRNSYTVGVRGYLPIWDWGEREARLEAQKLVIQGTELSIAQEREEIEISINNTLANLDEYQRRALNMRQNLDLAERVSRQSLAQYRGGAISIQDLMRALEQQMETGQNFLEAYMGYRRALLDLQGMTYYNFEYGVPVLERYGIQPVEDN
ncbi:MAG TPA: TolC family protein [Longimicrobiaceae bacterium]|nr:TolC family protein [Longimicrobiaceae bacterium]